MRVGPLPKDAPPKAAPARPSLVQRPVTTPARGGRAGVLTGSALPPPLPRAPATPPQVQAPAARAPILAEPVPTPPAPQPTTTAAPRAAERDWKSLLKARAPVLAGVGYVVLVAASAVFLLPMRPEHDGGSKAEPPAPTPTLATATEPPTETQAPIRAALATVEPAVLASTAPEKARKAPAPRPEHRAVRLAAAEPVEARPPAPEVRDLVVAQNATPVVPPPLPERAPTVPPPTQDPDAPMVTRLPEMR